MGKYLRRKEGRNGGKGYGWWREEWSGGITCIFANQVDELGGLEHCDVDDGEADDVCLQSAQPEHTMAPLREVLTAHDALIRVTESGAHEIPTPELWKQTSVFALSLRGLITMYLDIHANNGVVVYIHKVFGLVLLARGGVAEKHIQGGGDGFLEVLR